MTTAAGGSVEGLAGDAFDLLARVAHRVVRRAAVRLDPSRLPVVQPSSQLAHDEHVRACQHFGLERTCGLEAGPHTRRPQVRVEAERLADGEERRLGPAGRGTAIEGRIADSAEEYGVSGPRGGKRRIRQRRQVAPEGCGADDGLRQLERVIELCRDGAENSGRAGYDLRADTIAWKKKDDCVHRGEIVAYSRLAAAARSPRLKALVEELRRNWSQPRVATASS